VITAVLDSNVLVSGIVGFLNPASTPGQLLQAWLTGQFDLALSEALLHEVERALTKRYFRARITPAERTEALRQLRRLALITPLTVAVHGATTHPEDALVLATTLSAQADYLVTGDTQLQRLGAYQGVTILSPRAFLARLQANAADG
jgi:putative PIN family toxin of toxin-antitoxin system